MSSSASKDLPENVLRGCLKLISSYFHENLFIFFSVRVLVDGQFRQFFVEGPTLTDRATTDDLDKYAEKLVRTIDFQAQRMIENKSSVDTVNSMRQVKKFL